jgi:3-hydroxybutyryl-CoA dehydrogenase
VLVAHYFNPPWLIPLVEIVRSPHTSDEVVSAVFELLTGMGKTPVIARKEAPGFIGNRLQGALLREALSIVERGIATPEDVDAVVKNGFGRRLSAAGVFELFDLVGWDLILAGARYLQGDLESSAEPSPVLREKIERGELGVKTGKGFYEWTPESAEASRTRIAQALVRIAAWPSSS